MEKPWRRNSIFNRRMTYEQLKEEEKKLLPFELLSEEKLLESGFIKDIIISPKYVILQFKCGKALYIVGEGIRLEDKVNLVHVNIYESIINVSATKMLSDFYNSAILSKEQCDYILKCGKEYSQALSKESKKEKIKILEQQIKLLKKEIEND